MLTNYHTHCDFCDGEATIEAMARAALAAGFSELGFSSHAPLPFPTRWTMRPERLGDYVAAVRAIAGELAPALSVLAGLEVDYIEGVCGPADGRFAAAGLDYVIGSVHYVSPAGPSRAPADYAACVAGFTVDESQERFDAHLESFYGGDGLALAEDYYASLAKAARAGGFDILGHFDLVRKNNGGQRWFPEGSERYRAAAMEAVDAVAAGGSIVEINTGGMARGKTDSPYPAAWILRELRARGVEVCIDADAHAPAHLAAHRDAGVRAAMEAGYGRLAVPAKGGSGRRLVALA